MKPDFRKSMIWLHTYSGLLIGWLLFAIFFTGTLSYFNPEISQWMKPELSKSAYQDNKQTTLINQSLSRLSANNHDADRWRIYLPSSRTNHWEIEWRNGRKRTVENLSISNAEPFGIRDSKGGNFFRTFHYTLQLRGFGGRYIAGVAAMFMLIALFSGIFTHRRFFRDFFTLRKAKLIKFMSDFHAIIGIITLPFCIMICSSALMIYVTMYIPWGAEHYYDGGQKELNTYVIPSLPKLNNQAPAATSIANFSVISSQLSVLWAGDKQIDYITVEKPYKENGRVIVHRVKDNTLSNREDRLVFSSVTGKQVSGYPEQSTPAKVRRIFYGLHEAQFASNSLRWMLFILGLLSSALIATGLIIWLNKRLTKVKQRHFGHSIVERLNIAGISGLLISVLAYFHASRLLPLDVENRSSMEVNMFLYMWLAALLHSMFRPVNKACSEQIFLSSFLCFLLPIIDLLQDKQRLIDASTQLNSAYLTFNLIIIILGMILLKVFFWLNSRQNLTRGY